jgi:hypothetical protein
MGVLMQAPLKFPLSKDPKSMITTPQWQQYFTQSQSYMNIVYPEQFGNGPTAIQSAINSITSGMVLLTQPVYISGDINITDKSVSLVGYGRGETIITNNSGAGTALLVYAHTVSVSVNIKGFRLNAAAGNGIKLQTTYPNGIIRSNFKDLYISNSAYGLFTTGDSGAQTFGNSFEDIFIENVSAYGMYLDYGCYNYFKNIMVTRTADNAYSIYNKQAQNTFVSVQTDGCIYDQDPSTWIHPVIETIYATTPPVSTAFTAVGVKSIIDLELVGIVPTKCPYGLTVYGTVSVIENFKTVQTMGTDYPTYPLNLTANSGGVVINAVIAGGYSCSSFVPAATLENWTFINSAAVAGGSVLQSGLMTEEITLSTGGATTLSTGYLLPATSIIDFVSYYVTVSITGSGVTGFEIGDTATATRFTASAITGLTGGTAGVAQDHLSLAHLAMSQVAADKIKITAVGGTPTAGKIRVLVYYRQVLAPSAY